MGINHELYRRPAERGDISGPVIHTSVALEAIAQALEVLAEPIPNDPKFAAERARAITESIEKIRDVVSILDASFDQLTGWTPDQ